MPMDETAVLAAKLRAEGEKLLEFMGSLSDARWNSEVYTEGTVWTTRNVVAHLLSSERAFLTLFKQILDGSSGVSADFVIDRYNASQQKKMQEIGRTQLMVQYREARARMIEFVQSLDENDLGKQGRHPYHGSTSLREMVKMIYIHNQTHYRDIRRSLKLA
jgi:uncharacterized damage-inducible protein DinB